MQARNAELAADKEAEATGGVHKEGLHACLQAASLQSAVVQQHGFKWTIEHSHTGLPRPGFVSTRPGDSITFAVGSRVALASVVYMRSYKGVGRANVTCAGSCDCTPPAVGQQVTISVTCDALGE